MVGSSSERERKASLSRFLLAIDEAMLRYMGRGLKIARRMRVAALDTSPANPLASAPDSAYM
jgi:hypothetical protein